jgi:hypothetical protein
MADTGFTYSKSSALHREHCNHLFLLIFVMFICEKSKAGTALALLITERL